MAGAPAPDLAVVVCTLNGSSSLVRCIASLQRQRCRSAVELVVVDDGSTDETAALAEGLGVRVLRHRENLGPAAGRNTGVRAVHASLVAFLDDDCEVPPDWARSVVSSFEDAGTQVLAVGGAVVPEAPEGLMRGYLRRNNPLSPLELDLARSPRVPYRFARYIVRGWSEPSTAGRPVFSLPGASMCVRTAALREIGGFDAGLRFGSEDLDVCLRLRERFGDRSLWFDPRITVTHHFRAGLRDSLRRSRAYGRGHARMLLKHPGMRPTVFPLPLAVLGLGVLSLRRRRALALALLVPQALNPRGARHALGSGQPAALLDAYITVLLEGAFLVGAFGPGSGTCTTLRARLSRHRWSP